VQVLKSQRTVKNDVDKIKGLNYELRNQLSRITLKNPLVPSASPLSSEIDTLKSWKMPELQLW
jgi:hypothetical protein